MGAAVMTSFTHVTCPAHVGDALSLLPLPDGCTYQLIYETLSSVLPNTFAQPTERERKDYFP